MIHACIYCGKRADSREHIIATQFIELLSKDKRGISLPVVLAVTLPDGAQRKLIGKITKDGKPTLEYTTRVCSACNSGWMNDIDLNAYPYMSQMIQGKSLILDQAAQLAVATWITKVAVTARSEPQNPLPIEQDWTDWLYTKKTAIRGWYAWIGKYEGSAPWWYSPSDVRVELGPGSASPPSGVSLAREHGVLATLVIGYFIIQVFGVGGDGVLGISDEPAFPMIWPTSNPAVAWPPSEYIDDAGLLAWAQRIVTNPDLTLPIVTLHN